MRVIFMGTPEFAVPCLEQIIKDGHEVVLAVTQIDRPRGRGYVMTPPPVKVCAQKHNIPVYQPEKVRNNQEAIKTFKKYNADVAVVVAYGQILPRDVLDIPKYGCINVHASLLPKYRGAAPIHWAIINGETQTGVTTMQLDEGMDTGDMLEKRMVDISQDITTKELSDILMQEGAMLISQTLKNLQKGNLKPEKQDPSKASHAPLLDRSLSNIDWEKKAIDIHNLVRGLNPWPSASTRFQESTLKIHKTRLTNKETDKPPATILDIDPFLVACGENTVIELIEVQAENSKRMPSQDFARGRTIKQNQKINEQK